MKQLLEMLYRPQKLSIGLSSQKGLVSIAYTLAIVLLLFAIASALLTFVGSNIKGAGDRLSESMAFYAAESGIEMAIADLKNAGDGEFADLAIGAATVTTSITNDSILTSSATVNGITKSLQVILQLKNLPEAFYYVVSSFKPEKKLEFKGKKSPYLKGKIFSATNDKVKFDTDLVLDEVHVYVQTGTEIENKSSYAYTLHEWEPASPPVDMPAFDTQYYDDYINNVQGYIERDDEIEEDLNLTTLPGGVYYVDGDLEIEEDCQITGPGIIVASKKIEVEGENCSIGPDVILIAGKDLKFKEGATLSGMGSILYGTKKVEIKGKGTSVQGSIISPQKVKIESAEKLSERGVVQGIIYAGDKADIKKAKILGSIVATSYDDDFADTKIKDSYLEFSESYLPTVCPPGFQNAVQIAIRNGSWREL